MWKKVFILMNLGVMVICNIFITSYGMDELYYPGVEVPYYPVDDQWELSKINVEGAWNITTGSEEIVVAVIDSGISIETTDLSTRVDTLLSKSFLDENEANEGFEGLDILIPTYNDPTYDILGHGTYVEGIIGANGFNRYGIADVVRNVNLNNIVTKNGSYKMNNGILVIVPEDVEDYLNGTIEYLCTNDMS